MIAALFAAAAISAAIPSGSFTCQRLMAEKFDAASTNDFIPSVLGTFTLDGAGGYVHPEGSGKVVLEKGLLRFTEGTMKGIVAAQHTDAKGRAYLLIDKSIVEAPQAAPHYLDAVCYKA
jgi:hypothetical protein